MMSMIVLARIIVSWQSKAQFIVSLHHCNPISQFSAKGAPHTSLGQRPRKRRKNQVKG